MTCLSRKHYIICSSCVDVTSHLRMDIVLAQVWFENRTETHGNNSKLASLALRLETKLVYQ